jgi:TonB family protein
VQNSRVLKAFFITVAIYAFLIGLYFYLVPQIEVPSKKSEPHVVKLNLIEMPEPAPVVKTPAVIPTPSPKPVMPQTIPRIVQKEPKKNEVKITEEKKVKPKVEKKKPEEKKTVVKKKPVEKKEPKKVVKKEVEKRVPKPKVVPEKVISQKSESSKKFEEEMVYIPDAALYPSSAQSSQKQSGDLGSFLAMPSTSTPSSIQSYPSDKVRKLYGTEYHQFTATQKKFIKDNLNIIQQITQGTLTRRGYPRGAGETGQEGVNVVSFNLHPNGDISNLRLKSRTGYRALDENSITLIRVAYKDYPYPSTTTKIVFYVHYSIYGY